MRRSILSICAAMALTMIATVDAATATPSLNPGNGNYYELVIGPVTYTDAETAAAGMSFMGVSGILATITSASENAFITGLLSAIPAGTGTEFGAWMGAHDEDGEVFEWRAGADAGDFWSGGAVGTGALIAPYTYENWGISDPNDNSGGIGDALVICAARDSGTCANLSAGEWIDRPDDDTHAYVVEYEVSPVPEPAMLALFGLGLAGLGAMRRRRAVA